MEKLSQHGQDLKGEIQWWVKGKRLLLCSTESNLTGFKVCGYDERIMKGNQSHPFHSGGEELQYVLNLSQL